jgi:hypothetical protein
MNGRAQQDKKRPEYAPGSYFAKQLLRSLIDRIPYHSPAGNHGPGLKLNYRAIME